MFMVMFREKAKVMKVFTTTVQQFLSEHGLTSKEPCPPSSPNCRSQCMSGVKSLPPTQSVTPPSTTAAAAPPPPPPLEEEEELPDYVISFSAEECHEGILPITPPPSSGHPPNDPPSPIVWSNHNFVFHRSPQPLVLAKCKDIGLQLEESMVGESQLIGQVEDKYLATVSGDQLVLWDQHAVHERIRLEEMIVSTLTPDDSHSLRSV